MANGWDDITSWISGQRGSAPSGGGSDFMVGYVPGSAQGMTQLAHDIYNTEQQRYGRSVRTASNQYRQTQAALRETIDPDLVFGQAADAIGARGKAGLDAIRSSLSSRGLSGSSGASQGMLSRLLFQQQGAVAGAKRDVAIDQQRQRQTNAALQFANALRMADVLNAPASGVLYENAQNIYEGNLAITGLNAQLDAQRDASEMDFWGGLIRTGASLLPIPRFGG